MNLTEHQLSVLRHMLGINDPYVGRPEPYRNYAAVNPVDPEFAELERIGAVRIYRRASAGFEYDYYECTPAGRDAAIKSHKAIRMPKRKRIYSVFLDLRDCLPDLTFREFLTSPEFETVRRNA